VQRNAMRVWNSEGDFKYLVMKDEDIAKHLSPLEIERAFDLKHQTRHVDYIFDRVFHSTNA
jgi:adenylosuccinate lyase